MNPVSEVDPFEGVLEWYSAASESQDHILNLIETSPESFPRTSLFAMKTKEEARALVYIVKTELNDLAVLSLVFIFEKLLFSDFEKAKDRKKRKRALGKPKFGKLLGQLKLKVDAKIFKDVEDLYRYRSWVAHGKRWDHQKPVLADPVIARQCLFEFLVQARIATVG